MTTPGADAPGVHPGYGSGFGASTAGRVDPATFSNLRIYAKLRPTPAALAHLETLQQGLPQHSGKVLEPRRLHLTVLHFGLVREVHQQISAVSGIAYDRYAALLADYIHASEQHLPKRTFTVDPVSLAGFGSRGRTLAVAVAPSPELTQLHAGLSAILADFLSACGIRDVAGFMAASPSFSHGQRLRPHISLCRNFGSTIPVLALQPLELQPDPHIYPGNRHALPC